MSEPVAWMSKDYPEIKFYKWEEAGYTIPLYTHPMRDLTENNEAYEKGFIDGMAKQRDSRVQQMVDGYAQLRELTNEEIMEICDEVGREYKNWGYFQIEFARAILKKAGEK